MVAQVSETRGVVTTTDADGNPIVLAVLQDIYAGVQRSSLLVVDPYTGVAKQHFYQQNGRFKGDVYALILAKTGKLYVMFGDTFLEFDPAVQDWTFAQTVGGLAQSFAEGPDGTIYFATYPTSTLHSYDPFHKVVSTLVQLDPQEQYPYSLAVDQWGWVYAGIGTANSNLVAYNPKTGERRELARTHERVTGSGEVFVGEDGNVYGCPWPEPIWYLLEDGERKAVWRTSPKSPNQGIRWATVLGELPNGERIAAFNSYERRMEIEGPGVNRRTVTFNYESSGAKIISLAVGPDGRVYGSTAHPMRFFVYDPQTNEVTDMGGLERVGGGNFPNLVAQDRFVVGAAYNGGYLYTFDTTRPWDPNRASDPNPKHLTTYSAPLARPRAIVAHPDGRHVVVGGFSGYGSVGGSLAILDVQLGRSTLIPANQLIPGHSPIALTVLPDGNIVGGTSVLAPGGGEPVADIAKLFIFD